MKRKRRTQNENPHTTRDLLIISSIIIISIPSIVLFHLKPLQSTILYFVIPALYLLIVKPKNIKRIITASLGSIFATFTLDFFATYNKAWYIPQNQLVIPIRVFNVVPVDDMLWFCSWIFFIAIFYEHFIHHSRADYISRQFKYAFITSIFFLSLMIGIYYIKPTILQFHYAYFALILLNVPFFIILTLQKKSLLFKFFKANIFFLPVYLIFEITALATGQWVFPGHYIGQVQLLGFIFPFEEFFLWITISSSIVLSYYEFFIEDNK